MGGGTSIVAGSKQIEFFDSSEVDEFRTALERYGTWPVTVWECDHSDQKTKRLKELIGDSQSDSARAECFTRATDDRSVYRGKLTTSIFSPAAAAYLLNCYAPKSGLCFDPFAGGGTRAIMAVKFGLDYLGVELRLDEVQAIHRRLREVGIPSEKAAICIGDARTCEGILGESLADYCLTCPPYWNLEQYHGGTNDLSMAPTYAAFLAGLGAVVEQTQRILKPGSFSCWVVGLLRDADGVLLPLHHDLARLHQQAGFELHEEIVLRQRNNGAIQRVGQFEKGNRFLVRIHEYAMVFRRGL